MRVERTKNSTIYFRMNQLIIIKQALDLHIVISLSITYNLTTFSFLEKSSLKLANSTLAIGKNPVKLLFNPSVKMLDDGC